MEESGRAQGWIGEPTGGKEKSSMNPRLGSGRFGAALAALVFAAAACGGTGGGTTSSPSKGTLTVAGFNFPESSILAEIYGQALAHDGYTINYKLLLGTREVVAPALEPGQSAPRGRTASPASTRHTASSSRRSSLLTRTGRSRAPRSRTAPSTSASCSAATATSTRSA